MTKLATHSRRSFLHRGIFVRISFFVTIALAFACSGIKPASKISYLEVTPPPPKPEFRWSNGRMPKHLDPARAAAAPETDIVRAMYEGLTEIDPITLEAIPAVAEKWTASEDLKTWTFTLRDNAVWSNGKPVNAHQFVMSWHRLAELGPRVAHRHLTSNIVGMAKPKEPDIAPEVQNDFVIEAFHQQPDGISVSSSNTAQKTPESIESVPNTQTDVGKKELAPGFRAVNEHTLEIKLLHSDKDFPKLVANTIFMPVYAPEKNIEPEKLSTDTVTNGAFRLLSVDAKSLTLERSETYWNRSTVELERVMFKSAARAEDALHAYRSGELDAVTNANFEPLALKLLEPYEDLRKGAFAALNFYKINTEKPPFSDRRVRQALAMAIERERLTEGELEGSTSPALSFLPFATGSQKMLVQDKDRARDLLDEAGFPGGEQFPVIRLVVNRNDAQLRIAHSVARMWKQNLNVETKVIEKNSNEIASIIEIGDFDLVRRGVVLPTADETIGLTALFGERSVKTLPDADVSPLPTSTPLSDNSNLAAEYNNQTIASDEIFTEDFAIFEMEAIPLYFPTSYSLVKPYVIGFDMNVLDAPLLRSVRIDNNWKPKVTNRYTQRFEIF